MPSPVTARSELGIALQTLHELGIPFRGPFITPKQNCIYVLDACIVTAPEIIALHRSGKLTAENSSGLLHAFEGRRGGEDLRNSPNNVTDAQNRRRSQRVLLQVAVLLVVEMPGGNGVRAQAFTQVVNAHGGLLDAPFRMKAGQRLTLVNPQSGKQVGCLVVRVDASTEGYFPTAFEFDERSPHFWPISFPPLDWAETQEVR